MSCEYIIFNGIHLYLGASTKHIVWFYYEKRWDFNLYETEVMKL